ncbi:MAG: hypothetical protein U0930_16560 [Pirellulales bacterium]
MTSRTLAFCISALFLLTLGCNRNPATYRVKGKVVFPSGANVRMGTIETKSRTLKLNARGTIQKDGSFELTTFSPGDGAVAGVHDCVIVQMVTNAEEFSGKVSSFGMIDPKHNSYTTSGLSFEVKPEGPNEITLEVSPIRGKELSEEQHKH